MSDPGCLLRVSDPISSRGSDPDTGQIIHPDPHPSFGSRVIIDPIIWIVRVECVNRPRPIGCLNTHNFKVLYL